MWLLLEYETSQLVVVVVVVVVILAMVVLWMGERMVNGGIDACWYKEIPTM